MTLPSKRGRPKADASRDLRADLMRTSLALLDEAGPTALSLREVARRAGCTHQAPYHYFPDRESLLAALVIDGFEDLTRRLRAANDLCEQQGPRATLIASANAYVGYALEHPGVFRIMFRQDMCNPVRFPAVIEASLVSRTELERLNALALGPSASSETESILWAHVHGLACLLLDGPMGILMPDLDTRAAHLQGVAQSFADAMLSLALKA